MSHLPLNEEQEDSPAGNTAGGSGGWVRTEGMLSKASEGGWRFVTDLVSEAGGVFVEDPAGQLFEFRTEGKAEWIRPCERSVTFLFGVGAEAEGKAQDGCGGVGGEERGRGGQGSTVGWLPKPRESGAPTRDDRFANCGLPTMDEAGAGVRRAKGAVPAEQIETREEEPQWYQEGQYQ